MKAAAKPEIARHQPVDAVFSAVRGTFWQIRFLKGTILFCEQKMASLTP